MPTLSLLPSLSGSPPETDTARVNGGTEGREGQIAATTSGDKENTWTRVFQSYIQDSKQSADTQSKSIGNTASDTTKSTDAAASAVLSPTLATLPVVTSAIIIAPVETEATATSAATGNDTSAAVVPAAAPLYSTQQAAVGNISSTTDNTSSSAATNTSVVPVLPLNRDTPAPIAPATISPVDVITNTLAESADTADPTVETAIPVAAVSALTTSANPPAEVTAPVITAALPAASSATPPTNPSAAVLTVALPAAVAATTSTNSPTADVSPASVAPKVKATTSPTNGRAANSRSTTKSLPKRIFTPTVQPITTAVVLTPVSSVVPNTVSPNTQQSSGATVTNAASNVNTNGGTAAVDTSATPVTATAPTETTGNTQATFVQSLPPAVVSALSSAQPSTVIEASGSNASLSTTLPQSGNASGNTSNPSVTKDGMERDLVLGQSPVAVQKPADVKSGISGGDTSSEDASGDGKSKATDSTTSDLSGSSFSAAISTAGPVSNTASAANSAALVQGASVDERVGVVNQISQHIQSMQASNSSSNTMTVTVQPPHWGEVKIAVTINPPTPGTTASSVSATVTASTPEVQTALQQRTQDLSDSLSRAGIHLEKLDVSVGAVSAMAQSSNSAGHHTGQQESRSNNQDFQTNWSGQSANSSNSGGQFQSNTGWGADSIDSADAVSIPSLNTVSESALSAASVSNNGTAISHIDMRA